MLISLIFPCRDEERAIPLTLPKAIQAKRGLVGEMSLKGMEILVVDDGSKDSSLDKLKRYAGEIKIIALKKREGYGSAIKKGVQQAKGDWIAFCDLDNSCAPEDLKILIELARGQSAQAVWGQRLNKDSRMPLSRKIGNRLYQLAFLGLCFKAVPDPCSGFRLFKKSALEPAIYEFPQDLSFSIAFTAHCLRYKIPFSAASVSYKERLGKSKLRLIKDGLIFLARLIQFLFLKKYFSTAAKQEAG